ncbi:MAG: hypothetical protein HRT87_08390 [Legionellales bacterium]|nr:hypothetical protein [Legionellales bacterium]
MAIANKVDKKIKTTRYEVIRYQILTYCFFNSIVITVSDLNCLTILAMNKNVELTKFCDMIVEEKIFKSSQSARNVINKLARKNLIDKDGKNKKTVSLNSNMIIETEGLILLDFKILGNESQKS